MKQFGEISYMTSTCFIPFNYMKKKYSEEKQKKFELDITIRA